MSEAYSSPSGSRSRISASGGSGWPCASGPGDQSPADTPTDHRLAREYRVGVGRGLEHIGPDGLITDGPWEVSRVITMYEGRADVNEVFDAIMASLERVQEPTASS